MQELYRLETGHRLMMDKGISTEGTITSPPNTLNPPKPEPPRASLLNCAAASRVLQHTRYA